MVSDLGILEVEPHGRYLPITALKQGEVFFFFYPSKNTRTPKTASLFGTPKILVFSALLMEDGKILNQHDNLEDTTRRRKKKIM